MGKTRQERTWELPRQTRHAWLRDEAEPWTLPRQVLIVSWRRHSYVWSALVVYAVEVAGEAEPVVVQRWVPARLLRPVKADPNAAFGLR